MFYTRESGKTEGLKFVSMSPSSKSEQFYVLSQDLKKFTSYQLFVQPFNKLGVGPASNTVVATTMEDGKEC